MILGYNRAAWKKACNDMIILLLLAALLAFSTVDLSACAQVKENSPVCRTRNRIVLNRPATACEHKKDFGAGQKAEAGQRSAPESDHPGMTAQAVPAADQPPTRSPLDRQLAVSSEKALLAGRPEHLPPSEIEGFRYPVCSEKMHQYFLYRYALTIGEPILIAAVIFCLLQAGLPAALRDFFSRLRLYPVQIFCTSAIFYLAYCLLCLPLAFYADYWLEHSFGLSNQSIGLWAADEVRHLFLASLSVFIVSSCFLVIRKAGRGWHFPVWILLSAVLAALYFAGPFLAGPLFNQLRPLPESSLKSKIDTLCQKAGLSSPIIVVADKSRQTRKINAYASGFSLTRRIVLSDNLVARVREDQILQVVAHELAHCSLHHVLVSLVLSIAALYPVLLVAEKAADKFLLLLPRRWGIKGISDPASIPVWCIVILIAPLFCSPAVSCASRLMESQADAYAITLTGNPAAAARLFATLSETNLSDPDPPAFIEFWFFSHPSLRHRIDYALSRLPGGGN
jgi:STE24 endopeptidase